MHPRAAAIATALGLMFAASAVSARGELQAGPTLLEIQPGATSTRLQLSNTGDELVAAQVRVYAWTQVDGEDQLQETDVVVASPPIAEVPAGAEHLVRVVLAGPAPTDGRDQAYRVVVDELPGSADTDTSGVRVRMRFVLPAFVRSKGAKAPELSCHLRDGDTRLACRNTGGQPAQLGATLLVAGGSKLALSEGLFGYVLPGSERLWTLPTERPALAGAMTLDTWINGQAATVTVERRP
jgi:fimbrial chaperone protein